MYSQLKLEIIQSGNYSIFYQIRNDSLIILNNKSGKGVMYQTVTSDLKIKKHPLILQGFYTKKEYKRLQKEQQICCSFRF